LEDSRYVVVERSAVVSDRGDNLKLNEKRTQRAPISDEERESPLEDTEIDDDNSDDKSLPNLIARPDIDDTYEYTMPTNDLVNEYKHDGYIPLVEESTPIEELYNIQQISGHKKSSRGKALLRILWDTEEEEESWEPLSIIKEDQPRMVAQYISKHKLRTPYLPKWANNFLRSDTYIMRRMKANFGAKPKEAYGVKVPKNVKQGIEFDKINGNHLWQEAIDIEIGAMYKQHVFMQWTGDEPPSKDNGWQYAPIRIIFDVKHDGRHKATQEIGGHVTDATGYDTYAATVRTENVRLMVYVAVLNNDDIKSGDISTAYLNALTKEMMWTRAGPKFGPYKGMIIIMYEAFYGAEGSANAWYLSFADSNRQDSFNLSRIDSLFWYIECLLYSTSMTMVTRYSHNGTHRKQH